MTRHQPGSVINGVLFSNKMEMPIYADAPLTIIVYYQKGYLFIGSCPFASARARSATSVVDS